LNNENFELEEEEQNNILYDSYIDICMQKEIIPISKDKVIQFVNDFCKKYYSIKERSELYEEVNKSKVTASSVLNETQSGIIILEYVFLDDGFEVCPIFFPKE